MMKQILLYGILFLYGSVWAQQIPEDAIRASEKIQKNAIRAHMRYLADDLLEGRKPFTRGYHLASRYVASQFEEIGLKPGVGDSSYFQSVSIYKNKSTVSGSLILKNNGEIKHLMPGRDFLLVSEPEGMESKEMEIVFGGIGVQDPSLDYQDMENLNVKNKYVILFYWHPDDRSLQLSLKHMDNQRILRLKKAGAAGVILYIPPNDQPKFTWERFKYYFSRERFKSTYLDLPVLLIDWEIINFLFHSAEFSLDSYVNGNALPYQYHLNASLNPDIQIETDYEISESLNVLGYLQGSDPVLSNEYMVYTAHLDHEGIGRPIEGDSIYNGAYDNASGIAIMLEIARAFSELRVPPKRSVLFIALTAEEMGLLGSEYFVNHPTVELENMVASLNLDMFLMEKPLTEIVLLGEDLSGLGPLAHHVCQKLKVTAVPDPLPEENIFLRSDHINFVKKGVPSLFLVNSFQKSTSLDENTDVNYRWLKTLYHTPLDNFREDIYFEAGVTFGQINFLTGYLVAELKDRVHWNFDFVEENSR